MNKLEAHSVVKQYANHLALDKVSLEVPENSIYGLLGPNGAGKTTLIRIINSITAPDSGEVLFNGARLKDSDVEYIGYLPEERGLYRKMKVGEQALYLARLKGVPKSDALKKLKYWFEKFEIESWWDKKVEELSKGMQQKVQFITTVLHDPQLLIFDEPFSGFDPINANLLKNEILELREKGATIIFSTHNMASVEEICDDITLLNKSKVVLNGKVDAIKNQFKRSLVNLEIGNGIELDHFLPDSYSIQNVSIVKDIKRLEIKIPEGDTINDLLGLAIAKTAVHKVEEIIPTMNEIFINMVGEDPLKD